MIVSSIEEQMRMQRLETDMVWLQNEQMHLLERFSLLELSGKISDATA